MSACFDTPFRATQHPRSTSSVAQPLVGVRYVQYACHDYQRMIRREGTRPSMSRKGDCSSRRAGGWDNSVAESFFSTLKKELVWRTKFETRDQTRREIFEFIEVFYNRQRMHSYLGYLSPVEFQTAAVKAA